jgi:hypothetical protein
MGIISMIQALEEDIRMTEKVKTFKGVSIAKNYNSQLYAEKLELAEYKFLTITIVGPFNVKTNMGYTVGFESDSGPIVIETDTMDIISDYSKKLELGITQFDIDLEDHVIEQIVNLQIKKIWIDIGDYKPLYLLEEPEVLKEIVLAIPEKEPEEINPEASEEKTEGESLNEPEQNEE